MRRLFILKITLSFTFINLGDTFIKSKGTSGGERCHYVIPLGIKPRTFCTLLARQTATLWNHNTSQHFNTKSCICCFITTTLTSNEQSKYLQRFNNSYIKK